MTNVIKMFTYKFINNFLGWFAFKNGPWKGAFWTKQLK